MFSNGRRWRCTGFSIRQVSHWHNTTTSCVVQQMLSLKNNVFYFAALIFSRHFFTPEHKKVPHPCRKWHLFVARRVVSCESGNGFTLLGESEPSHLENLSHRLKVSDSGGHLAADPWPLPPPSDPSTQSVTPIAQDLYAWDIDGDAVDTIELVGSIA